MSFGTKAEGTEEWLGRLGDGRMLSIQRGAQGDRLFTYADRARYHLDAASQKLTCAPARGGSDWLRVLLPR